MITENLSTLKIHKLTKEQYERELANGTLDENALYLTPDEEVDLSGYVTTDQLDTKADSSHTHDDRYYTETEIDSKISTINTSIAGKAASSHTHAISDVTNLQSSLDAKVPTSRTVNGKALSANITLSASDVGAAASSHSHNDVYYTETEVDELLAGKSDTTHNHDSAYDAKGAADTALASAKTYADNAATTVKNDLLNGAGTAYDTLKELGNLIDDNTDAIDALEAVAAGKQATITGAATTITADDLTVSRALVSDASGKVAVSEVTSTELGYLDGVTSNIQTQLNNKAESSVLSNYYTKTETDALELITVADIDAICGTTIQVASASEVTF